MNSQRMTRLTRAAVFGLAAVTALASGCAERIRSHGQFVEQQKIDQLTPGVSTSDDVQSLFGPPTATATFDGNVWYYIGQRLAYQSLSKPEVLDREVVIVTFRAGEVVDTVDKVQLQGESDVPLINRETPTSGRTLGVLEQLLGNMGRFNNQGGK
jgi:outer membrane protein assembly factor BamE (lipoprotein component of BamABCDE complex)